MQAQWAPCSHKQITDPAFLGFFNLSLTGIELDDLPPNIGINLFDCCVENTQFLLDAGATKDAMVSAQ
jgi:hypothetical protein